MALVSDRDRATGTLGSGSRWQALGYRGFSQWLEAWTLAQCPGE